MNKSTELRQKVDQYLDTLIERYYREVPYGDHFISGEEVSDEYYVRHTKEIALRIRQKRIIDSLVIHYFAKTNSMLAKKWANYTDDEMMHGQMFAKDLERAGYATVEEVFRSSPMLSTKLLNGYFMWTLEHEGPLASLASAYYLEYTGLKTQPSWVDNLEKVKGQDNLKGARQHINHDLEEDHSSFVWNVLYESMGPEPDEDKLFEHLSALYGLLAGYGVELYQTTILGKDVYDANSLVPAASVEQACVA